MPANSVTLIGNLVDDPELRFTASGVAMAKVRFAVNRRYQRQGEWQEETSFFGGTLWRDAAENAAESLQKGMRVIVTGRLEQQQWETKEGEKRSSVEVAIDEIGPSLRWATATVTRSPRIRRQFRRRWPRAGHAGRSGRTSDRLRPRRGPLLERSQGGRTFPMAATTVHEGPAASAKSALAGGSPRSPATSASRRRTTSTTRT